MAWKLGGRRFTREAMGQNCEAVSQAISSGTCRSRFSMMQAQYARCYYSVTGKGSDVETRIIIATGLENDDLEDKPWPHVMRSFDKLAGPIEPRQDWGAILVFLGSDLEYACNDLAMQSYNEANVCGECEANGSDIPHSDFSDDAKWRSSCHDNEAYIAKFRKPLHPLVAHGWFKPSYRYDLRMLFVLH